MRKPYTKPDVVFESFSLSTSIAAGCAVKLGTPSAHQCGFRFGHYTVFVNGVDGPDGCAVKVVDGSSQFNGLCYHVPTDLNSLFNS